jgi:hypothetical protein
MLYVNIKRIILAIGTDDMAEWHIVMILDNKIADANISVKTKIERLPD